MQMRPVSFTAFAVLFLAIAFVPILLSAAPSRHLRAEGGSAPNIYLPGETIELVIDLAGAPDARTFELELYDFLDRKVFDEQWAAEVIFSKSPAPRAAGEAHAALPGGVLVVYFKRGGVEDRLLVAEAGQPDLGVFRARLTFLDSEGEPIGNEESTFARIPDVRLQSLRPDSPFGIGAYYAMRFDPKELAVASKIQQVMGAAWDRDELLWDIVEPEQGKWTWERTDRAVRAAHEHHIEILGLLDYWGKWAKPLSDEAYAGYANYVKTMVNRYKPGGEFARAEGWTDGYGIRNWEIWNEPATFWTGSGEQFGRLLKVACEAVKAADPEGRVFFSEAGVSFNRAVVAQAGLDSFDGVTPHYYCPPRSPEAGELDRNMKKTVEDFATLGVKGRPFWVSEFGWPSTMDPGQMRNQAIFLVRSHVYGFAAGLGKFFWYNFVNDGPNKDASHFGLINREDWTPRLGFGSYAAMVHFLDGASYRRQVEIVRPARIFVFEKGKGSLAVLWSSGASGTLAVGSVPDMVLFDLMGNQLTSLDRKTKVRNSKSTTIPLGSAPVYLDAPSLSPNELARRMEDGTLTGIVAAEARILSFVGSISAAPKVSVEIENTGTKPISGTVELTPPKDWITSKNTRKIPARSIAPGETRVVAFAFEATSPNPDNRYPFRAVFSADNGDEAVSETTLFEQVARKGTPTIDGDPSDWKGAPVVHLDTPDKAVGLVPYMDWNLSTDIALQWDDDAVYFLGVVRDNEFSQPHSGSLIWEGDSFQLAFDTRPGRGSGGEAEKSEGNRLQRTQEEDEPAKDRGLYLYGLAHTAKGDETWTWPTPGNAGDEPATHIRFAFRKAGDDRYVYEAAIPYTLLAPLRPKEGAQFGFTMLLNDNDGGGRRGWLELTPGIGTGFQPQHFLTWTLTTH